MVDHHQRQSELPVSVRLEAAGLDQPDGVGVVVEAL